MHKCNTDDNKYSPTAGEEKLLQVLLSPESIGMTVVDICKKAGVSRTVYYDAHKKDGFLDLIKDLSMELLKGKVSQIVNAAFKSAAGEKGYQDRKMLLTMVGMYSDKLEQELKVKEIPKINIKRGKDDE